MTLILDSGGISALAGHRARLAELRKRDQWPPQVPTAVLTEALTGDHRRDFHANRFVHLCQVRDVTEPIARLAASLRTNARSPRTMSAVDAIVVALATGYPEPAILTSDPTDIGRLVGAQELSIAVIPV